MADLQNEARFYTERRLYRYSPDLVVKWIARQPGSRAYYSAHFRAVFGRSLEDAWAEWVVHEKTFQQANLAAIRKYPLTPATDLSSASGLPVPVSPGRFLKRTTGTSRRR